MNKVMLVIDEFTELEAMEAVLKRVGFDVFSLSREVLVSNALLRFQPEIAVISHKGRNVDGLRLASRLKSVKVGVQPPKIALLYQSGQKPVATPELQAVIDALAESPMQPNSLLRMMAQLGGQSVDKLLAKFDKFSGKIDDVAADKSAPSTNLANPSLLSKQPTQASQANQTERIEWDPQLTPGQAAHARSARTDRYAKFLKEHDEAADKVIPKEAFRQAIKQLDAAVKAEGESAENEKNTANRRDFAKAMFEVVKENSTRKS